MRGEKRSPFKKKRKKIESGGFGEFMKKKVGWDS